MTMSKEKRSAKELVKRYSVFIISLFVSALGVAFVKKADLGMFPISSVPNIMSMAFDKLTLGSWLIIWNCLLIIGQILLLRKKFQYIQFLQIPLSVLFGYFTDFAMWLVAPLTARNYLMQLAMGAMGIILVALSVFMAVTADVVMNSGEAFVKALTEITHQEFARVKTVFDVGCVVLSVILSMIFFDMHIVGTREGTLIAALTVGSVVGLYTRIFKQPLVKWLTR